jgi:hypothetical protein
MVGYMSTEIVITIDPEALTRIRRLQERLPEIVRDSGERAMAQWVQNQPRHALLGTVVAEGMRELGLDPAWYFPDEDPPTPPNSDTAY